MGSMIDAVKGAIDDVNSTGKITAEKPSSGAAGAQTADNSLPDPTPAAKVALGVLVVVAVLIAWLVAKHKPFEPSSEHVADFALFAAYYVVAQVIATAMTFLAPVLPFWGPPKGVPSTDKPARAAYLKADRALLVVGVSLVAAVLVSCLFGLYFLRAVGMKEISLEVDAMATGILIAGGAKPLHDFVALIQNQTSPKTKTSTED